MDWLSGPAIGKKKFASPKIDNASKSSSLDFTIITSTPVKWWFKRAPDLMKPSIPSSMNMYTSAHILF